MKRTQEKVRVLLLEDSREDADIFRRYAERCEHYDIEIDHRRLADGVIERVADGEYDALFVDYRLKQEQTGLDVLKSARSCCPDIPVIVLTGVGDESLAVEIMKAGATDYLSKGHFDSESLERSIRHGLEKQRMLSVRTDRLRSLGEMAAGIAHELNQPLVGVRGLAEHLLLGMEREWPLDSEKAREKLEGILDQADRMSHVIQHVRTFSREAGKPETRPVNVNEVLNSSLGLLGAQLRSRGVEVHQELTDPLPAVTANPFSLEEVFVNCLTNARDAIEDRRAGQNANDGVFRVCLRTLTESENGTDRVVVEIEDTGEGIASDKIDRVFDLFYTTKGPERGTGLGLSISKSIVDSFGGTIDLESEPGQGTTVRIALPTTAAEND
jgi:signal transduction histidine kinase